jgi:hypothetical protein
MQSISCEITLISLLFSSERRPRTSQWKGPLTLYLEDGVVGLVYQNQQSHSKRLAAKLIAENLIN